MSYPSHPGIYAIVHTASGRLYIGSSKNIYSRWREHKCQLNRGTHHCPYLQNAWTKYGAEAFEFKVIEMCLGDAVMLCAREQHWLDRYRSTIFNTAKNADPNLGIPQTQSMKEASRQRMLGNKHGEGTHYHGKLTERDIVEILHRFASGETTAELGKAYGVTPYNISRIARRVIWWRVEVPPEVDAVCRARAKTKDAAKNGRAKLGFEGAEEARRRRAEGETYTSIAKDLGVTLPCVRNAVIGLTWNQRPIVNLEIPEPKHEAPLPKYKRTYRRKHLVCKPRPARIVIPCATCGAERLMPPCKANRKRYCSPECHRLGKIQRMKIRMQDPDVRAHLSAANKGKKASEEARMKISAGLTRFYSHRREESASLFDGLGEPDVTSKDSCNDTGQSMSGRRPG